MEDISKFAKWYRLFVIKITRDGHCEDDTLPPCVNCNDIQIYLCAIKSLECARFLDYLGKGKKKYNFSEKGNSTNA